VLVDAAGCKNWRTENPRVGSSILSLATIQLHADSGLTGHEALPVERNPPASPHLRTCSPPLLNTGFESRKAAGQPCSHQQGVAAAATGGSAPDRSARGSWM
jgi:hypothetical protein